MSTLERVSSERHREKTQFYDTELQEVSSSLLTGISITENVYSEANPEEEAYV